MKGKCDICGKEQNPIIDLNEDSKQKLGCKFVCNEHYDTFIHSLQYEKKKEEHFKVQDGMEY